VAIEFLPLLTRGAAKCDTARNVWCSQTICDKRTLICELRTLLKEIDLLKRQNINIERACGLHKAFVMDDSLGNSHAMEDVPRGDLHL